MCDLDYELKNCSTRCASRKAVFADFLCGSEASQSFDSCLAVSNRQSKDGLSQRREYHSQPLDSFWQQLANRQRLLAEGKVKEGAVSISWLSLLVIYINTTIKKMASKLTLKKAIK